MSESTKSTDYRAKRAEYSVLDIPEYWICDPLKERVTVCTLLEGWYEAAEFAEENPIESTLFSELRVPNRQILNP
ncbi:Uma2 family endonuclease [Oscillatoria sp. CS-180]|uniref:Uma2 family endonuclease n=1 Tax=Oscillatoria sp. CS-180 TaxID=3021720 RepID=UPI00232BB77A|nr:Uma2 family endonuclease [Oscillatoria sp. CS-180]MDB9524365.1 Uma2 family endonuclease [Oscillatoria sp. CS-180]